MRCSTQAPQNSVDSLKETSSDAMGIIRGINSKTDPSESFAAEKKLNDAILNRCVTVNAKGEEVTGFVVEVRIEMGTVIIDFAGAYSMVAKSDQIDSINYATEADVREYCEDVYNKSKVPTYFKAIQERIDRTLKN